MPFRNTCMKSIGEKYNKRGGKGQESNPKGNPDNIREGQGGNQKNIRQSCIHGEIRVT